MEQSHDTREVSGRPLERRAAARTAVVWSSVRRLLEAEVDHDRLVVDVGGGTGGFAVRVAELGHRVTVVDPSPDALAILDRRAAERDVADRVTGVQGDLGDLRGLLGEGHRADLALCHGVLGVLDDPAEALGLLADAVLPGGRLSLLVGQRHAAVLSRAMAGHFVAAQEVLDTTEPVGGERRFTVDEITGMLTEAGFVVEDVQAVRVFSDLVPSSLLDLEPGALDDLVALERAVATRPEYLTLATQVHVVARR